MDNLYEHACEIESAIELAVNDEQFEEAAKLKIEYDQLRKKDLVDTLLLVSLHAHTPFLLGYQQSDKSAKAHLIRTCARICGFIFTALCFLGEQELDAAVENEDYARAAELRDTGCAGLIGWWQSRADNDPAGHLLRIAPDFGRYTAVMYTPRDFAELKVRSESCAVAAAKSACKSLCCRY